MTLTEGAAWWGAIIASLAFSWNVYKWIKRGPQLSIHNVIKNAIFTGDPRRRGKRYVTVRVTNTGDQPTTITKMGFFYYKNLFYRIFKHKHPESTMIVADAGTPYSLPYKIYPGNIWDGAALQDEEISRMIQEGHLLCVIGQSHSKKYVKKRIPRK